MFEHKIRTMVYENYRGKTIRQIQYWEQGQWVNAETHYCEEWEMNRFYKTNNFNKARQSFKQYIIECVENLENEGYVRPDRAVDFFGEQVYLNPCDYIAIRRAKGFNPRIKGRKGTCLGEVKGKRCYLIRKDSLVEVLDV